MEEKQNPEADSCHTKCRRLQSIQPGFDSAEAEVIIEDAGAQREQQLPSTLTYRRPIKPRRAGKISAATKRERSSPAREDTARAVRAVERVTGGFSR
jgi:hypothetical protein